MRAGTSSSEMGPSREPRRLADAAGRPAARAHALRSALTSYLSSRRAATAVEYGLIVALMTLVIVGAINTLGYEALTQLFEKVASSM